MFATKELHLATCTSIMVGIVGHVELVWDTHGDNHRYPKCLTLLAFFHIHTSDIIMFRNRNRHHSAKKHLYFRIEHQRRKHERKICQQAKAKGSFKE